MRPPISNVVIITHFLIGGLNHREQLIHCTVVIHMGQDARVMGFNVIIDFLMTP